MTDARGAGARGRPLRVGVVPGVTPDRWLRAWRERYPRIALTIVPIEDAAAARALEGDADLVFARLPVPGLDADAAFAIPLWEETPVVAVARDHPVKLFDSVVLADLDDERRVDGWDEAALDLVAAGHAVAVLPQAVLRATGRRDVVGRPVRDAVPTRIGLVWLRSADGPLAQDFVGVVRGRTRNSSR